MDNRKKNVSATIATLLVSVFLVAVSGSDRSGIKVKDDYAAQGEEKSYTIMVYMNGSNLESEHGAASSDLEEMIAAVMKNPNIEGHIVLETGGSLSWEIDSLKDSNYSRFQINQNGIHNKTEMDIRNMGEADTLTDFINYSYQSYPAQKYILLFWNHGNGAIEGFGYDENFNGDSLELAEIDAAIANSAMAPKKFELIGFDACLMGNVELANMLSPYTKYLVASPELEPQNGWNYSWMSILEHKDITGHEIGTKIVDSYMDSYSEKKYPVALSLLDTFSITSLTQYIDTFFKNRTPEDEKFMFAKLSKERTSFQGFGSGGKPVADIIALEDLMANLQQSNEFQTAYQESVVYHQDRGYAKPLGGLSIYLPSGADEQLQHNIFIYKKTGFSSNYIKFVTDYAAYLTYGEAFDLTEYDAELRLLNQTIEMKINPIGIQEIAGAYLAVFKPFTTAEGETYYFLLTTDSEVDINLNGTIRSEIDNESIGLCGETLCLIEIYNTESSSEYLSPLLYNGQLCFLSISFDAEHENGNLSAITPVGDDNTPTKERYQLKIGDSITPLYPIEKFANEAPNEKEIVDLPNSDTIYQGMYYKGNEISIKTEEDCMLEQISLQDKDYLYGFMLTDTKQKISYTELFSIPPQ